MVRRAGEREGRVIVGVQPSVAGLRALRLAVAEARRRGPELHAVRVWEDRRIRPTGLEGWPPYDEWFRRAERAAADTITNAFREAMGGIPADLDVEPVPVVGKPGRVLVGYAYRDADVLYVGHRQRGWLGRLVNRSVAGYCVAHAACPVQVVPPDAFGREATGRGAARALRRDLTALATPGRHHQIRWPIGNRHISRP
jgi:nucleotide-binding universal stress UspA family protein